MKLSTMLGIHTLIAKKKSVTFVDVLLSLIKKMETERRHNLRSILL